MDKRKNKSKKKPVGRRFDNAMHKTDQKINKDKDKIMGVKEDISDAAHDIAKSVKKTTHDSGNAVSGLFRKK